MSEDRALRDGALRHLERGWSVLPLEPAGKRPLWGLGWENASRDRIQVTAWWEREPQANIGVACTGGLAVLDVDGEEGETTLSELVETHGDLPFTLVSFTGRGRHLYFTSEEALDGWRYGGLELKSRGYVCAPPSKHANGRPYHYPEPDLLPAPLVNWLVRSPRPMGEPWVPPVVAPSPGRLAAAGKAALEGELDKLEQHSVEPGSGRHTALYAAAAALGAHVAAGSLSEGLVRSALADAADRLGLPPNGETEHQIEHGLEVGREQPYVLVDRPRTNGTNSAAHPGGGMKRRLRALAGLELRAVEWAWEERIPLGKLTVIGGAPGQGKSMLSCWLAAKASKGTLPGNLEGEPITTIIVSGEDDPEDTIYPRLIRAGADFSKVFVLDMRDRLPDGSMLTRSVMLPDDVPEVLEALDDVGARLLILDPIGGLISSEHSTYNAQHVRHALGPFKAAMEERHAATVMIHHVLLKSQATDPLARLADSHAFAALPRSVLLFGPDPDDLDDDRGSAKVLTVVKSNLAGKGQHGLKFSLKEQKLVSDGRGGLSISAGIQCDGPTTTTGAEMLQSGEERTAFREAIDFVREFLADGPRTSADLRLEAESRGISIRTLERARSKVCGRAVREDNGPWMVGLREQQPAKGNVVQLRLDPEFSENDGAHSENDGDK